MSEIIKGKGLRRIKNFSLSSSLRLKLLLSFVILIGVFISGFISLNNSEEIMGDLSSRKDVSVEKMKSLKELAIDSKNR